MNGSRFSIRSAYTMACIAQEFCHRLRSEISVFIFSGHKPPIKLHTNSISIHLGCMQQAHTYTIWLWNRPVCHVPFSIVLHLWCVLLCLSISGKAIPNPKHFAKEIYWLHTFIEKHTIQWCESAWNAAGACNSCFDYIGFCSEIALGPSPLEVCRLCSMLPMWKLQKLLCLEVRLRDRDRVVQENDTRDKKVLVVVVCDGGTPQIDAKCSEPRNCFSYTCIRSSVCWIDSVTEKEYVYCEIYGIILHPDFKPFHCMYWQYWASRQIQFSRKSNHMQYCRILVIFIPWVQFHHRQKTLETHSGKKRKKRQLLKVNYGPSPRQKFRQ